MLYYSFGFKGMLMFSFISYFDNIFLWIEAPRGREPNSSLSRSKLFAADKYFISIISLVFGGKGWSSYLRFFIATQIVLSCKLTIFMFDSSVWTFSFFYILINEQFYVSWWVSNCSHRFKSILLPKRTILQSF